MHTLSATDKAQFTTDVVKQTPVRLFICLKGDGCSSEHYEYVYLFHNKKGTQKHNTTHTGRDVRSNWQGQLQNIPLPDNGLAWNACLIKLLTTVVEQQIRGTLIPWSFSFFFSLFALNPSTSIKVHFLSYSIPSPTCKQAGITVAMDTSAPF